MKYISIFIIFFLLLACENTSKDSPSSLFTVNKKLNRINSNYDEESFAMIEGLQCNDSLMIILDYHTGNSFSLFNVESEKMIGRFGTIGQGPGEIPLGCYGYLNLDNFYIYYDPIGLIAKYQLDSLRCNISNKPTILTKYQISEAFLSQLAHINDNVFLGAGVYKSKYQFILFNEKNEVLDYNIDIYNDKDKSFNEFHKYLSNQGVLRKHPNCDKFVYCVNYSSNIDIIEVSNNKINLIKSIRLRNPQNKPLGDGELFRILPDHNAPIGYIDIATDENYIYALYTDKRLIGDNGVGNLFNSNIVLVFDWEGRPIHKYILENEAYYIAINERSKRMFAAIKMENGGWNIELYNLP